MPRTRFLIGLGALALSLAALAAGQPAQAAPNLDSKFARKGYVDSTQYDTTSILKLIETRWGLQPLGTRDAAAGDLTHALAPEVMGTSGTDTPFVWIAVVLAVMGMLLMLSGRMLRRAR